MLQWIIERRMAEARRLLVESDARVQDVGARVGYDDAGHFSRQFHRIHGSTPQRWRLAQRVGPAADANREIASLLNRSSIAAART